MLVHHLLEIEVTETCNENSQLKPEEHLIQASVSIEQPLYAYEYEQHHCQERGTWVHKYSLGCHFDFVLFDFIIYCEYIDEHE